jgi:purine-nucleoside/S-methyl-5'-thioadenosine phosphorylase / adenosine deaminase
MELTRLKVDQWERYDGLLHGFMGRRGGKSVGPYAGLNVSYRVGDDNEVVSQNVCDVKHLVGIHDGKIVTMRQVHGDQIIEVKDKTLKEAGEADAMVTAGTGIHLGVLTADCVPILILAPKHKIVAAVHAGWRGTLMGIAAKMVRRFNDDHGVAPEEIEAALGPSIGACCYEVKDDVTGPLREKWGRLAEENIQIRGGKSFVDLRQINCGILEGAGLPSKQLFEIGSCTCCAPDDFFSYRREKKETGRQMSFIGWVS